MASKPGLLRIVQSVIASAFGVQSHKNYQQDFTQSSVVPYVVVGVVFVVLLVVSLVLLVRWILPA
ncbi:DUF2970 domain-containing protein [Alteromonas gilva]|uniref:DUF2970 domain-containing protein n=1 Tax=Alteromonas gilva TaxID=2987522 RepID=A0ABT5L4Y5_9ALTE|nr:DUF2970 domain-containing protein [Alteromonas gilva]MDC8832114.1 DUF2970 domain-containing protein [Alteromonas gilva]